jgi:hypothetical protein
LQADLLEEPLSCAEVGDVRVPGDDALLRLARAELVQDVVLNFLDAPTPER